MEDDGVHFKTEGQWKGVLRADAETLGAGTHLGVNNTKVFDADATRYGSASSILGSVSSLGASFVRQPGAADLVWPVSATNPTSTEPVPLTDDEIHTLLVDRYYAALVDMFARASGQDLYVLLLDSTSEVESVEVDVESTSGSTTATLLFKPLEIDSVTNAGSAGPELFPSEAASFEPDWSVTLPATLTVEREADAFVFLTSESLSFSSHAETTMRMTAPPYRTLRTRLRRGRAERLGGAP